MLKRHLDTKRLLALYEGETEDLAALEHLASCARCKNAFDDSRWLQLLRRLPALAEIGSHPGPDELAAYRQSALSSPRVGEIERHLRSCAVCLAAHRRGWAEESLDDSMPPSNLIDKAQQSFRPDRQLWLGTVLVTGLERGPSAVLLSDRRVASGPTLMAGEIPASMQTHRNHSNHPSSAAGRARRLIESRTTADGTDSLCVEAAGYTVVIRPPSASEPDRLHVSLDAADDRPVGNVRLRVRSPSGEQTKVSTNARGRASLAVARGRSRIVIEVDPPLAFSLSLLD